MMMRVTFLLLFTLVATPGSRAEIIDRIAATVDREVITLSQVNQLVTLRIIQRREQSEEDHRKRVLNGLIAQMLRYRDVQRFGADEVSPDTIEARLRVIMGRFASPAEFDAALRTTEMTLDEVRALIKRRLQVEAYIEERFSPIIFVSIEEIETYYRDVWVPQRQQRGLPVQPLDEVREEIRTALKATRLENEVEVWTNELRSRANVDVYVFR